MELMKVKELTLHDVAKATPLMTGDAYIALKDDIDRQGQLDPVVVYRGKIVDGRHRWLILQELAVEDIKVHKLPNNTTIAQLKDIVVSKEIRRHETPSQLAITAYRYMTDREENVSQVTAARMFGANRKRLGEVKKIDTVFKRPDILEQIFSGKKINTGTSNIPFWTDSLGTIIQWLTENTDISAEPKVKARTELTEDEQTIVNEYFNAISKEADIVINEVASMLYMRVRGE